MSRAATKTLCSVLFALCVAIVRQRQPAPLPQTWLPRPKWASTLELHALPAEFKRGDDSRYRRQVRGAWLAGRWLSLR